MTRSRSCAWKTCPMFPQEYRELSVVRFAYAPRIRSSSTDQGGVGRRTGTAGIWIPAVTGGAYAVTDARTATSSPEFREWPSSIDIRDTLVAGPPSRRVPKCAVCALLQHLCCRSATWRDHYAAMTQGTAPPGSVGDSQHLLRRCC